jgi:hypothetical protein
VLRNTAQTHVHLWLEVPCQWSLRFVLSSAWQRKGVVPAKGLNAWAFSALAKLAREPEMVQKYQWF